MLIVTPKGTSVGHSESFECLCVKIGPWVWPGRVPEKKKKKRKKEKSHARSIFCQNSTSRGGATGYLIGTKFGRLVGRFDLITHANFKLDRLRIGCVALHESLLSFRFSALHRLSLVIRAVCGITQYHARRTHLISREAKSHDRL